jgi:transposase
MATQAERDGYPTDLTDEQWAVLAPLVTRRGGPGRPPTVSVRRVVDALLYQLRAGCAWRLLPRDFPHWTAVRYYFDKWTADGTWEEVNHCLVEQAREQGGRAAQPTAAIIDSQSSKTTEAGGPCGFDGGKKGTGAQAAPAGGHRRASPRGTGRASRHRGSGRGALAGSGARPAMAGAPARLGRSGVYGGSGRVAPRRVRPGTGRGAPAAGDTRLHAAPRRWVVERTIAWLNRNRRLSKHYERTEAAMESWCYLASIALLLRRLHPNSRWEVRYAHKAA